MSTVYLLHFDQALPRNIGELSSPVQHYMGYASQLARRLEHHAAGRGARLTAAAAARGISWVVARTWNGDRTLERRLKNRKEANRLCPACRPALRHRARAGVCQGCSERVCVDCLRHLVRVTGRSPHWRHAARVGCR